MEDFSEEDYKRKVVLKGEAYDKYLGFLSLEHAKKSARSAYWLSIIAISLTIITLVSSIYYHNSNSNSTNSFNKELINEIKTTKKEIRDSNLGNRKLLRLLYRNDSLLYREIQKRNKIQNRRLKGK